MSKEAKLVDEMLRSSVPCDGDLIRSLEQSLDADPSSLDTKLLLAMSLAKDKRTADRAIDLYLDVLAEDEFSIEALYGLAVSYYSLGKWKESRKHCERLYRVCPDNTQARDLHNAVAYKQARQKKKNKEDAVKVGSGVAIGIGILTGAVLVAKALGGSKR